MNTSWEVKRRAVEVLVCVARLARLINEVADLRRPPRMESSVAREGTQLPDHPHRLNMLKSKPHHALAPFRGPLHGERVKLVPDHNMNGDGRKPFLVTNTLKRQSVRTNTQDVHLYSI